MGADLYHKSIMKPAYAKYHPEWEKVITSPKSNNEEGIKKRQDELDRLWNLMYPEAGYFRDSYNSSNLLWTLGMSWWQLPIDDDGYMGGEKLKKFRDQVFHATIVVPRGMPEAEEPEPLKYFEGKRLKLLTFLDGAINAGESVMFSV